MPDYATGLHHVGERAILTFVSDQTDAQIAALNEAIGLFPSVVAFASAIGVAESAPHMWRQRKRVPADYCPAILRESAARGHPVTCERLRPDIPWGVLREQVSPKEAA